jgi:hypothetical protein
VMLKQISLVCVTLKSKKESCHHLMTARESDNKTEQLYFISLIF